MTAKRTGGAHWRLLVHEFGAAGSRMMGRAHHIESHPHRRTRKMQEIHDRIENGLPEDLRSTYTVLAGTEFDELVVGRWLHIEQMDTNRWWMNVGGVTINVAADRDGNPKRVSVEGPGDYDLPVEGCEYHEVWSHDPAAS